MIELTPTFSGSDLKRGAICRIEGYLYQYLYPDPFARIEHPRFQFRCLAGQKKKADLTLNKNNIRKAYLVPGYKIGEATDKAVQQSLF